MNSHAQHAFWRQVSLAIAGLVVLAVSCRGTGFESLVHHWSFDEGPDWHDDPFHAVARVGLVRDSVGGAHARLVGMDGSAFVSGRQRTALAFDGVDDVLLVREDLGGVLGGTASLSFWLRTRQRGAGEAGGAPGLLGSRGVQWGWIDREGRIALSVDGAVLVRSAGGIADGRWHHIALTRDAKSGLGQVFVDGVLSARGRGPGGRREGAITRLCRMQNGTRKLFRGRLDQVHVFAGVVDAATVAALRTNCAPKTWEVTCQGENDAPFETASVLVNTYAYDVEGDALRVASFAQPAHGEVSARAGGSFSYAARKGFRGSDSFVVVLTDGRGGFARNTVHVRVGDPPAAGAARRTTTFTGFHALEAGGEPIALSGWRVPRALDWDGDGDLDLLIGSASGVWRYENTGSARAPRFAAATRMRERGAHIALADLAGDGRADLIAVAPGGKVVYGESTAVPARGGGAFTLPDARFDAADWNGDGLVDLIAGSRSGEVRAYLNCGSASAPLFDPKVYVVLESGSYNLYPRVFDLNRNGRPDYIRGINWGSIDFWLDPPAGGRLGSRGGALVVTAPDGKPVPMKALTDGAVVDPGALGAALEADHQALLNAIKAAESNILLHMRAATLAERREQFAHLAAHVRKYPFLQMGAPLDTAAYHHLPSIAGQNLMTLHAMLPDTPGHRRSVADAVGLRGLHREIYLQMGLHLGDNQRASRGQLEAVRDFMALQPRESFPDAALTLNHYYGDGRGGWVCSFRGAKNTFNFGEGKNVSEWAPDLNAAALAFFGAPVQRGDYFTFVMGHEVTHSLDGYVASRANADLWRRKGQMLALAARPGDATRNLSFMRGNIDWFLGAPQEALATQANHHWAHSEARLIGAIDRYRRGVAQGIEPMKANITEVLTFLDWISCGLNKIVMQDTEGVLKPYPHAVFHTGHAWLERDDNGYITALSTAGRRYEFAVDESGVVTALVRVPKR